MTKHAHIYEQIILCSGLVRDIKRMKIIIICKNMKDCREYFRADIFRYLYDDDDQSFEGHIGEDIGQDWAHWAHSDFDHIHQDIGHIQILATFRLWGHWAHWAHSDFDHIGTLSNLQNVTKV